MPPALSRMGPYRFYMVSADQDERPHVHVARDRARAKFWIDRVEAETDAGFSRVEMKRIERLIVEHQTELMAVE